MSRLRDHQNENFKLFSAFLKKKLCSSRGNAPISQEIVFEIVGLASAFVHLHNEISEGLFRVWVNEWVVVDNFRKATLFNAFLDDKLKVVFVGVGCSRNSTNSLIFWYFSRKSPEVFGKRGCRFDIQVLGENQNFQKFL